mmetsp:Transcript_32605/g.69451  ORF Transcript_32605/g.69451 Transcript_32605/m.69451 type:complete len:139 (+) Transcript_32605:97-513(+)
MRTACRHYIPMYLLAFMVLTVSAAHDFSDESISSSSAKELGKVGRSNQMMRREHTVIDALGSVSLHSFAEADSETRTGSNIFRRLMFAPNCVAGLSHQAAGAQAVAFRIARLASCQTGQALMVGWCKFLACEAGRKGQ